MIGSKLVVLMFLLLFAISGISNSQPDGVENDPLRVMSYNIRYHNPDDGINRWTNRRNRVANLVRFNRADIIGMQEVLHSQLKWLDQHLEGYAWVGVGRTDGKMKGEYSPIFYDTSRVDSLDSGTFWLSPQPDEPGVGWDAALPRICTWILLQERSSGRELMVFNTHFDHIGEIARDESAKVILDKMDELSDAGIPLVLTGDFNTEPGTEPYEIITGTLHDAMKKSRSPHYGPMATFFDEGGGFSVGSGKGGRRIDYIFVSDRLDVLRHGILSTFRDGYFPSDHLPVVVDIAIGDPEE
ncbi:MAG: endonuclease/exonuclease/phosphatase family protein [Balneolaceae bacterium]|nr:endonuclease/exonuclease/phosphatase family protein [Balneolaceae bacterium]